MKKGESTGFGKLTRREFVVGAAAAGFSFMLGGIGRAAEGAAGAAAGVAASAASHIAQLKMGEGTAFKILQITDVHFHFLVRGILGEPEKVKAIKRMAEIFKPDLIANTGDFWASNEGGLGADMCKWSCAEFAKAKTPWAFAWGNHDEANDYPLTQATLEKAPYSLYRGASTDGNYTVEVRGADGAGPLWNLIFLNDSRGGFKDEQIDWFNAEAERIRKATPNPPPALLFFHIPVPQYESLPNTKGAMGVMFEKVCHEGGSREALGAFAKAGFVKACFCGHDHVNDCFGVVNGIRLQYGRALGGYGADKVRKGGTLITVDTATGKFETMSVFADGSTWTPAPIITTPEPGKIY